jgi:hypothetical protein
MVVAGEHHRAEGYRSQISIPKRHSCRSAHMEWRPPLDTLVTVTLTGPVPGLAG